MNRKILSLVLLFACFSCAEANDKPLMRLGVLKFLSRADGVSEQQAAAIGDIFARFLTNSPSLVIVERDRIDEIAKEHQIAQSGPFKDNDIIQLGKLMTCNYMLTGSVTNLERKVSEVDYYFVVETRHEISATIDVRVIDVETSKVIMAFSENGTSSRKGEGFFLAQLPIKSQKGKVFEGVEESAIAEAAFRATFKIREALVGDRIQVIDVAAKEITINAGESLGVGKGVLFGVYSEGKEVFNLDGTSMGRKLTLVAVVRITDTQRDFSYAQVVKNGGKASSIRKGYKLVPLTKKEADTLVKQIKQKRR